MADIDREKFPNLINGDYVSNLQVMKSHAGYYLGRSYFDTDYGFEGPYCRETYYFDTREEAESLLESYNLSEKLG